MSNNTEKLLKLKKGLEKSLEKSDFKAAVDLLDEMREYTPTVIELKQTRLGLVVQRLIKHSEPDVSTAAKLTIAEWKKKKDSKPATSTSQPKEEILSTSRNKESARQKVEGVLLKTLQDRVAKESSVDLPQIAGDIEASLFKKFKETNEDYVNRFRELVDSLRDSGNQWLIDEILDRTITPQLLVNLSNEELASPEEKEKREQIRKEWLMDIQKAEQQGTKTDMFTCGKCKRAEVCITAQVQTRSADEPMTLFLKCMHCGQRWKQ